jgi:acyl-CoA reductase-like NAD-dependent aldehyde dehydrogenase
MPRRLSKAKLQRRAEVALFEEQLRNGDAVALGRGTTLKQRQAYNRAMRNIPFIAANLGQAKEDVSAFKEATRKHREEEMERAEDDAVRQEFMRRNRQTQRVKALRKMQTERREQRRQLAERHELERAKELARTNDTLYGARHVEVRAPRTPPRRSSPARDSPGTDVELSDEEAEIARQYEKRHGKPVTIDLTLD